MPAPTMNLQLPSRAEIISDLKYNRRGILKALLALMGYVLVSSSLINLAEGWSLLDLPESLYFSVINVTTVGFGDVVPVTSWGRFLAGLNSLVGVILVGVVVATVTAAFQKVSSTIPLMSRLGGSEDPAPPESVDRDREKPSENEPARAEDEFQYTNALGKAAGAALRELAGALEGGISTKVVWMESPQSHPFVGADLIVDFESKNGAGIQFFGHGRLRVNLRVGRPE